MTIYGAVFAWFLQIGGRQFQASDIAEEGRARESGKEKMLEWIANGVELALLIDGDKETIYSLGNTFENSCARDFGRSLAVPEGMKTGLGPGRRLPELAAAYSLPRICLSSSPQVSPTA